MTNLTEGKPSKVLVAFTLPVIASAIFQQLYNIADTVIVGQFVGENALAAVGASYPITMIFMAIAMGCNIGCSVIISQLYGAKKLAQMKTSVSTSFIAFTVLSLLLTGLGLALATPLMRHGKTACSLPLRRFWSPERIGQNCCATCKARK